MKQMQLYILPVNNRVVFPYQTINIRIPETYQYDTKRFNSMIGILPTFDNAQSIKDQQIEMIDNFGRYGTILKITSEDRTFYTFTAGQQKSNREVRYYSAFAFGRFRVLFFEKTSPFYLATIELISDEIPAEIERSMKVDNSPLISSLRILAKTYIDIVFPPDTAVAKKLLAETEQIYNKLVFTIASYLDSPMEVKQKVFQINDFTERVKAISLLLKNKSEEMKVANDLQNLVRKGIEKDGVGGSGKKSIPVKSNGPTSFDGDTNQSPEDELALLEQQIKAKQLPEQIFAATIKEFKRLKNMRGQNAEANVIRTYIDTILEMPWNDTTPDNYNLQQAKEVLHRDHSGLDKVKKRILEFLAVRFLKGNSKGTIICLVGPPGVGKTSLGKSIADSLGRKFERISLGGVRDEAEVRGHRRTYVGAMPGVFAQALRRCQSKNPVILLDEIDKINRDSRGDPSSALLEVLDPSQNSTFTDHYLGLPFDLSNVMFIATANQLETIQGPLLDRMEIITIPGYTHDEKREIATKYLIPKQIDENGINKDIIDLDKNAVDLVIKSYTREAGVRQLERSIGAVCRSVAVKYSHHKQALEAQSPQPSQQPSNTAEQMHFAKIQITPDYVRDVLGIEIYDEEEISGRISSPGVAIGLAYTAAGGKTLIVESSLSEGKGRIEVTGQLGDVMKESIQTAVGWIKSNIPSIEYLLKEGQPRPNKKFFDEVDIHVHFPAAATPKDGPSAGITITTALLSLITGRKVRHDIAMTGEISLKGIVLPVGGIREKCLAAYTNGINTIILPYKNRKDTEEIAPEVRSKIQFIFVKNVIEVIEVALEVSDEIRAFRSQRDAIEINKQSKL